MKLKSRQILPGPLNKNLIFSTLLDRGGPINNIDTFNNIHVRGVDKKPLDLHHVSLVNNSQQLAMSQSNKGPQILTALHGRRLLSLILKFSSVYRPY